MTNGYTPITAENVTNYPFGTRLRFNYGPMGGEDFGTVFEYRTSRWGTVLAAELDSGEIKTVSGISTVGIGVYLDEEAS